MDEIKLVVGLGNPGPEYSGTRHNAGFWWIDELAGIEGSPLKPDARMHGHVARLENDIWLLKPQTFMNRSGQSVSALCRFYKMEPQQVLVVQDELDLEPGDIRLKNGGGHGGHNGLRDIAGHLGTSQFWRLRIGIGHPGDRAEVANYVLKPPRKEEEGLIREAISRSLSVWPQIRSGQIQAAMLKLHTKGNS